MSITRLGASHNVVRKFFLICFVVLVFTAPTVFAAGLPPAAPTNPSAAITTSTSITWSWQDQSPDENGFTVWTGPGAVTPSTLSATTPANSTSWQQTALAVNSLYSFQVAAANIYGTSAKTTPLSAWTLAVAPVKPVIETTSEFEVAVGANDGNPANTLYAIKCTTRGQWLQEGGRLDALPLFQTASAWGSVDVVGLMPGTTYSFGVFARNGAGVTTAMGPEAQGTTAALASVPGLAGLPRAQAESAIVAAALTVGKVTESHSSTVAEGRVISQDPVAGTQLLRGLPVGLVISLGPVPVLSLRYSGPNPVDAAHGACVAITVVPQDANGTVSYQWYRNNGGTPVEVPGETDATLLTTSVCTADAGQYYCEGSDSTSTAVSEIITLNIGVPTPALHGLGLASLAFLTVLAGAVTLRQRSKSTPLSR